MIQKAVLLTASIVAAKRAIEHERADRLFDDPYAARLAGDEISILLERWQKVGADLARVKAKRTRYIAIRTRFYDDFLKSTQANVSQVVILGAGMDARAFRMHWLPNTRLYEVDCPEVLQYKNSILNDIPARCDRVAVAADLSEDWLKALLNQGFRADLPSVWLLEGVLMYLPEVVVHKLLQTISNLSVAGSYLGADFVSLKSVEVAELAREEDRGRVLRYWQFGSDRPEDLLADYGWSASVLQPGDEEVNFGRYTEKPPVRGIPNTRHIFLVRARRIARSNLA
jgi:methyltransferase (TIGR00027 family)